MSNCNDLFQKFLDEISLPSKKEENLQRGRDAIRGEIISYFSNELKVKQPEFYQQGSYALKTMVRPLGEEDYDLDDGVYLKHTDDNISKPTPLKVSEDIIEAVKKHTKKNPENLTNCVRIVYSDGYHIDLPIYRNIRGRIHLGTLEGKKWIYSDAKKFNNWFHERLEKTEQMRRCIKYLKAWKDFKSCELKGIHITVLVGLNHFEVDGRDDMSLLKTTDQIIAYLNDKRAIYNPIDKSENLIENWAEPKLNSTIKILEDFNEKAKQALETDDKQEASKAWRKAFGVRFPKCNGANKAKVAVVASHVVASHVVASHREFESRTKPWGRS